MSRYDDSIGLITVVATALGHHLPDVVFVGGSSKDRQQRLSLAVLTKWQLLTPLN